MELVDKPDATETTFILGGPGIARNDAAYVPLQVLNTVLGGHFTSCLNDELRVNAGLACGAGSAFTPLAQSGTFAIELHRVGQYRGGTRPGAEDLRTAMAPGHRRGNAGIGQGLRERPVAAPLRDERTACRPAGRPVCAGVARAQIDNFMRDAHALTPARARVLVDRYFPRKNLQMVLIGKADDLRKVAGKYGDVTELDLGADGFRPAPR